MNIAKVPLDRIVSWKSLCFEYPDSWANLELCVGVWGMHSVSVWQTVSLQWCDLQLALLFIDQGQHLAQNVEDQFFAGIYHCHSHSCLQKLPLALSSNQIPLSLWSLNSFNIEVCARSKEKHLLEVWSQYYDALFQQRNNLPTYQGTDIHSLSRCFWWLKMKSSSEFVCSCPFAGIYHLFWPISRKEFQSLPYVIQCKLHQLHLGCWERWFELSCDTCVASVAATICWSNVCLHLYWVLFKKMSLCQS